MIVVILLSSIRKKDRKETERETKKYENLKEKSSLHLYDSLYFKKILKKIHSHAHIQLGLKIHLETFQGTRIMYKHQNYFYILAII